MDARVVTLVVEVLELVNSTGLSWQSEDAYFIKPYKEKKRS